jgi:hypothetical protein
MLQTVTTAVGQRLHTTHRVAQTQSHAWRDDVSLPVAQSGGCVVVASAAFH